VLITGAAFAQTGKKPASKEKPPTQKEMEDMKKEAQKAMEKWTRTKKDVGQHGIKMPSFKNIPAVSDKQLATAWEDEARLVPKKDLAG